MAKRKKQGRKPCNDMEVVCYGCGKLFVPAPQHVYKEDDRLMCTWSCLCDLRRRKEQTRKNRGRSDISAVEMLDWDGGHITFFPSARAAGDALGVDPQNIRAACGRGGGYCAGYLWRWEQGSPAEKRAMVKQGCILQSYADEEKARKKG